MRSCAHGVGDATPRCRAGGLRGPLPINRTQPLFPPNPAAPRHGAILRQQPNGGGATTPLPAPPRELRAGPSGRAHRCRGGGSNVGQRGHPLSREGSLRMPQQLPAAFPPTRCPHCHPPHPSLPIAAPMGRRGGTLLLGSSSALQLEMCGEGGGGGRLRCPQPPEGDHAQTPRWPSLPHLGEGGGRWHSATPRTCPHASPPLLIAGCGGRRAGGASQHAAPNVQQKRAAQWGCGAWSPGGWGGTTRGGGGAQGVRQWGRGAGRVVTPPHPEAGTAASPPPGTTARGAASSRTREPQRNGAQRRWLGDNNGSRCGNANSRSPIRTPPPSLPPPPNSRLLPHPTGDIPGRTPLPKRRCSHPPTPHIPGAKGTLLQSGTDPSASIHPPQPPSIPITRGARTHPDTWSPRVGPGAAGEAMLSVGPGRGLLEGGSPEHSRWECRGSDAVGQRTDESDPVPVPVRPRGAAPPRPAPPRPASPRPVRPAPTCSIGPLRGHGPLPVPLPEPPPLSLSSAAAAHARRRPAHPGSGVI